MLHTYYYINGQRVNAERYYQAADDSAYSKKVFEKAKAYFEKHEYEWQMVCMNTREENLGLAMVTYYELNTEEGRQFRAKWIADAPKRTRRGYMTAAAIWIVFLIIVILGFFFFRN